MYIIFVNFSLLTIELSHLAYFFYFLHNAKNQRIQVSSSKRYSGETKKGLTEIDNDDDETCLSRNNPLKDRFTIIQDYCE